MTLEEVKMKFGEYRQAEKEYKNEAEKHFPTNPVVLDEPLKFSFITKEQIMRINELKKIRDQKENDWHKAMIEYQNHRNKNSRGV